jgi:hypothetical protein
MASDPLQPPRPAPLDEPRPLPPLAGTRSQSVQRLQIGLVGLASMVLLVGLASIILRNAQENQARVVPEAAATVAADKAKGALGRDPLADAGVVPDLPDEAPAETGNAGDRQQP